MERLLSFLICGAQKSGTTALYHYLSQHPDLQLSNPKELHIFDRENRDWSGRGINNIDKEISNNFMDISDHRMKGEATPVTLYWEPAPARIWKYNPSMKLIVSLRNPITRAYSHWNMEQQKGREDKPFNTSVEHEEKRSRESLPLQHRVYSYLSRGFYSEQIRRFWRFFPREQTLIIKQDDLRENPQETLRKVFQFMEVCDHECKIEQNIHQRSYQSGMPADIREKLISIYQEEIETLESMLQWNCEHWIDNEERP